MEGDGDGEGKVEIGRQRLLREWKQRDKKKNSRGLLLGQFIDATMQAALIGDAVQICSVNNC